MHIWICMVGWMDRWMDGCTQYTRTYTNSGVLKSALKNCLLSTAFRYGRCLYLIHHTKKIFVSNAKGSYPTKNNQCMQLFALAFCLPKLRIAGKNKHANKFFMAAVCIQNNFHFNSIFFYEFVFCLSHICFSFAFVREFCDKRYKK